MLKNGREYLGEVLVGYKQVIKLEELRRYRADSPHHVPDLVEELNNIKVN